MEAKEMENVDQEAENFADNNNSAAVMLDNMMK